MNIYNDKIKINGYFLDEEQLKPVIENEKYSLIIAGAGSGKTLTLIGKIKYLLDNNIYDAKSICCLSFTNEATENLHNNILKNCNVEIDTYTFHKLALKILEQGKIKYKISDPNLLNYIVNEFFLSKCFGNITLQKIIYNKYHKIIHNDSNWQKIINSKELESYKKTMITFINLMKANGLRKEDITKYFKIRKYRKTLIIIYAIITIYESEKLSTNSIDFDDMMLYGTNLIKTNKIKLPYKIIIVDEFQDTSLSRFNLINEIIKLNDASLCVVGDDFQSIYRFSGCDLNLFLNFKDYFPLAKIYKLEKTYRNSIELIQVANKFIEKNKKQIKKDLTSPKNLKEPVVITYFKNIDKVLENTISRIEEDKEIMIISRNNFDLQLYTKKLEYKSLDNNYIEFKKFSNRKIRFLTIHSSKGLESDVVIILNVKNNLYGLPSKLKDERVLSLIKANDIFPYEEERRLFYVALTRTKSKVFLLTPKNNPSIFIKELKSQSKQMTKIEEK